MGSWSLACCGLGLVRVREDLSLRACDAEGDISVTLRVQKVTSYSGGSATESVHR